MVFTSVKQAVQIEQSKLLGHTGTFPQDYPYVGAALAAITRGDLGGDALHLSSLARLNADLSRLRNTMPPTFDHFVKRWRDLVQGFPESAKDNAPLIRGWRIEVLTAAQLASAEVPFEIGDYNPRAVHGQPDLIAHFAGTRLSIECGSVEAHPGSDLADRVRNAVWNKEYDARKKRLREYVGPNALLVLDITSVAARHAAESGGTANLDAFTRSVARALSKRAQRHGTGCSLPRTRPTVVGYQHARFQRRPVPHQRAAQARQPLILHHDRLQAERSARKRNREVLPDGQG